ncbi:MAG TPA: T9SS type A sorting domain-containing protein [Bacteroidia bacterium]|nr:T9SS type A sorting domain-containing protein [Bacteroidia bacterium]HNS11852.1 T9SS type A sorting domain-containing protein [Bacteroidia bacterium]
MTIHILGIGTQPLPFLSYETMKNSLRVKQKVDFRFIIGSMFVLSVVFGIFSVVLQMGPVEDASASAGNESISKGSFIINLGVSPQSNSNALKPYGMLYDLIHNYDVAVKWIINTSKSKDGTDFTYNSVNYKTGAFIIPVEFINSTISGRISYWESQGIVGTYTTTDITVPVYTTLTAFPLVMIDSLSSNQDIIETYYQNAAIPSSAYSIGTPAGLSQCYDVWTNPHGDPTWATHYYLYDFVTIQKSWIWAECHSVSMMEYCQGSGKQLNFLTSSGLKCYGSNKCGSNPESHAKPASSPFTYFHPTEPVMQFLGNAHGASSGGSEQWFQPLSAGQWNSNTRRGITTGTGSSPKEGTVLVYGPAFNDLSNGWVMYQGGHDLNSGGTASERIASQRAYFNFILLAGTTKKISVTATLPSNLNVGQSGTVSSNATSGTPPYTYQWTSSLGGNFLNSSDSNTTYTAPVVTNDTLDIVKIKVTDQCGRVNFYYQTININSSPLPVELLSFNAARKEDVVLLNWSTASELNNDYFSIERSLNGESWSLIGKVKGQGNSTMKLDYTFQDREPSENTTYYRLSQTDYDGKSEGFKTVKVGPSEITNQKANLLRISPNPFAESFNFEISSNTNESAELSLFSSDGSLILRKTYSIRKGNNRLIYSDNMSIEDGVYYMALKTQSGKLLSTKIIKRQS